VVRALETAAAARDRGAAGPLPAGEPGESGPLPAGERGESGPLPASAGWTHHLVTPQSPPRVVDALFTGLHEPRSSHLLMLTAFAGPDLLRRCYAAAVAHSYLWHEFGDVHLLLP
jgi:S-adenosylmethionine:tRNA ribosyltransferase-isomerase